MVDRTVYDADKTPDLPLRQVLGRQRVATDLCKLAANAGLLTVETFAMLGDDIASVKAALKSLVPDVTSFGTDGPAQELALTSLAAVWKTCSTMQDHFAARRAKMEEDPSKVPEIPGEDHAEFRETFVNRHPDVLLPLHREPHRKFVERVQRDYLVHGFVHFYEVGEIRTRNEQIAQKSGLSKNAEDLLRVVMIDQPAAASSESQVMDKLHAFFITLEYLNICEFTVQAGPLKYLAQLGEWRHENCGLALLLAVDALIRKKVHRVSSDQRKQFTTFSAALLEVLTNHKQLWNDARSSAEPDKFKQATLTPAPVTPKKRPRSGSPETPASTAKAKKNKARRARQKNQLQKAKAVLAGTTPPAKDGARKPARDERVPAKEWQTITSFKYSDGRRCPFYNSSLGCRFGDQCKLKHSCAECGKDHPWHGNHCDRSSSPQDGLSPPPGDWSGEAGTANDGPAALAADRTALLGGQLHWPDWDQVLSDRTVLGRSGPFFLELFAVEAGISDAVFAAGVPVLPPVDVVPSARVTTPRDLLDALFWQKILEVITLGLVFFLHCGTPCNTFTAARKLDGGPPPLRSADAPLGLPNLSEADRMLVFLGNLFLERTVEACYLVFILGGDFMIENPLLSLLWETELLRQLVRQTRAFALDCDQCAFGTPWMKPTRFVYSTQLLDVLCIRCPGTHKHEPFVLCASVAAQVCHIFLQDFVHLQPSFGLTTPSGDRKRALGSGKPWVRHRQATTAQKALQAGYQLKRGACKPLLEVEMEPGEAIAFALRQVHLLAVLRLCHCRCRRPSSR